MNFFVYTASVLVKKSKKLGNAKNHRKTQGETMVKKELGKLKMELGEIIKGRWGFN